MDDVEIQRRGCGTHMLITFTPRAMRALGLRGRVVCEIGHGRKAYSVPVHRVLEQVRAVLNAIGAQQP
jgi:hypothetical protein